MSEEEKNELAEHETSEAGGEAQEEEVEMGEAPAESDAGAKESIEVEIPPPKLSREELKEITMELAVHLGETEKQAIRQIEGVVKARGREFSLELLEKTLEVERKGGMMINNGERRRTAGGVFFYLVRGQLSYKERYDIFPGTRRYTLPPTEQIYPLFEWENRQEVVQAAKEKSGEAEEVTVTLRGRPKGEVEMRHELVIFSLEYQPNLPTMPKGVPILPNEPTNYVIYVSDRQWQRVGPQIEEDQKDLLIINGYCFYDREVGSISVHTTHITTRGIEKAKKNAQTSADGGGKKKDKQPKGKGKQPKAEASQPAPEPVQDFETMVDTSKYPEDVAKKLVELFKAQATFQKRVAEIEAKSEDEQYGLEMARKLLKSTEDQIEAIEKQYAG